MRDLFQKIAITTHKHGWVEFVLRSQNKKPTSEKRLKTYHTHKTGKERTAILSKSSEKRKFL